eukprot:g752.t1
MTLVCLIVGTASTLEDFQQLLQRRLNLKLPLPLAESKEYLQRNQTPVFGRIAAQLAVASEGAPRPALRRAEELLRSWVDART